MKIVDLRRENKSILIEFNRCTPMHSPICPVPLTKLISQILHKTIYNSNNKKQITRHHNQNCKLYMNTREKQTKKQFNKL